MSTLVLNAGSSTLKYKLFRDGEVIAAGLVERLSDGQHHDAVSRILRELPAAEIGAVGHRVVHGGEAFAKPTLIDAAVRNQIEACIPLAPLHNPGNLAGIDAAMAALPGIPHVAVFDTAFHSRLPRRAKTYAIPKDLSQKHGVRKYGFHGTSHQYVAEQAALFLDRPLEELRIISCHLGNGASICAIEYGRSVETSMGMTPLEGLVMGTRVGDIDAGAILALLKNEKLSLDELDVLLNKHSGLLGISGISNDVRDIEKAADAGDENAQLALTCFCHRVRKYIGAYAAVLGGVDAVIFTGGIGQNADKIRERIARRFEYLGLLTHEGKNASADVSFSTVADISQDHSRVRALVIATDEEKMIATEAERICRASHPAPTRPIPIAVSARHVHLDRAAMDLLFGAESELTPYKPLSQPGQYACEEKVDVVGPRGRIDGVRILGPLRRACQIEVSRTDEYKLGVDAPIRHSGDVKQSAPITIVGPKGQLELTEGLICAWRHIHMTPEDAEHFGVVDRDVVRVDIDGGDRDLTFGDVVVRVSPKYALEMHIDTDEANAAELSRGATGALVGIDNAHARISKA